MRAHHFLLLSACTEYEFIGEKEVLPGGEDSEPAAEPEDCEVELTGPGELSPDEDCAAEPPPGSFAPVVEWQWYGSERAPGYEDIMMMPAVGDVDLDGMPELVFTGYSGTGYASAGALYIVSGVGVEEAGYTNIGGYRPLGSGGVALGELDGASPPEIVVTSADNRLLALHADGSLLWASEAAPADFTPYGYPLIADLDADGRPEVSCGRLTVDGATGALISVGPAGWGGAYSITAVADLDLDGQQELIAGNGAWHKDGSALWTTGGADGWAAVGDFDGDGLGEVAAVGGGVVWLLDTDGTLLWGPTAVPGGGGGPPTVADFDGDGAPEVGVAGATGYAVYDTDGSTLWVQATTDASSAQTGSAVFDFEGDGAWEVVYADELVLWIYDGATGAPLLAEENHSSWTLFEYPPIVDVDADGEAEIVLASNDSINPGWAGITVLGDALSSWAPTAAVWSQHAWHLTNAADDLSIPRSPAQNWTTGHNSYRAGGLGDRPGIPLADLTLAPGDACWSCDGAGGVSAELVISTANGGLLDPEGPLSLSVYRVNNDGSMELLRTEEVEAPASGQRSAATLIEVEGLSVEGLRGLRLRLDDPGSEAGEPSSGEVEECDEENNSALHEFPGCE